jgi:hypothetical protein
VTRTLLVTTAVIEVAAGLALALAPSVAASILLGSSLDTLPALIVGRVAGAALLSLGAACWLARNDQPGGAVTALVAAMWLYNTIVALLLIYAGVMGLRGLGLWPAALVHAAMAIWCVACLRTGGHAIRPDLHVRR